MTRRPFGNRRQKARELLAVRPSLATANIFAAAAVGDVEAVADFLANGANVNAKGGPFSWEPLLYAAYSRLSSEAKQHSTLEAARLLLEHKADPNAGFLWDWGGQFPCLFTALTGVLGLGESDVFRVHGELYQPPHPQWSDFARSLLEAGADPNDNQGLYNRMQYPDDQHLKLLFDYGLGTNRGGPWFERFFRHWPTEDDHGNAGYVHRDPSGFLSYQLRYAIKAKYVDRVKLLVEGGADVHGTGRPAEVRSPYALAMYHGSQEIADFLVANGASAVDLSGHDEFVAACNRVDSDRATELVSANPSLLNDADELLCLAAEEGRTDCLRLLIKLGCDVNGKPEQASALFSAALAGQLAAVKFLVEHGADVHAVHPDYDATPLSAANHKDQYHVMDYLFQFASMQDAVRFGGLDRIQELLHDDPNCATALDENGRTPLHHLGRNTRHGIEIIKLLIAHGADPDSPDNNGVSAVDYVQQNGREDLVEAMRRT